MRTVLGGRLGLRERIWAAVVVSIAVVLIVFTWGFNLVVADRLSHEADNVAAARATAELDGITVTRTGVRVSETLDAAAADSPTWVFDRTGPLEQPRTPTVPDATVLALTRLPRGFHDVPRTDTRLYGVPIVSRGRRVGTIVSAVALGPYERIRRVALIGSCLLALVALIAVALATRWLISRALRPVAQMTSQAAEWSEHDLGRRFSLGEPRDEFTRLAATLDGLLDRVATSLRHEQNLTAELSHELRTPLTQIYTEAQYALRHTTGPDEQDGYRRILASAGQMTRILDTLISAARMQAGAVQGSSDAEATAATAIEACSRLATEHAVKIALQAPPGKVTVGVDAGVLERVLAPLLENACRYANHAVTVAITTRDSTVDFEITDDGPGIPVEDFENVFASTYQAAGAAGAVGAAGAAGAANDRRPFSGAGLGLPLARRLAQGVGGDVRAAESSAGARLIVSLPRG